MPNESVVLTESERRTIWNTHRFMDNRESLPPSGVSKLLVIIQRLTDKLESK